MRMRSNPFNMSHQELEHSAARGNPAASRELLRRAINRVNPDAAAAAASTPAARAARARDAEGRLVTKQGTLYKRQKGDAKRQREAGWSDKRKAHVERSRRVMSYARDLMQELGWYPGEAIRVAWADEKAGKLRGYTPKSRTAAPEGLFEAVRIKGNPFGYNF
jgi:hypothetical protein